MGLRDIEGWYSRHGGHGGGSGVGMVGLMLVLVVSGGDCGGDGGRRSRARGKSYEVKQIFSRSRLPVAARKNSTFAMETYL